MNIKMLVMDVDGTLTDGKVYISGTGELFKSFSIKDGYGIKNILAKKNIRSAIITGRISEIVRQRAEELNISVLYQAVENKALCLEELRKKYNLEYDEIAYIGDDLNDLDAMLLCGIAGCPADADISIRQICNFISTKNGGSGAVREFIDWLVERNDQSILEI